ncbi:MAG: NUDIX domain-containing protein [Bacilli bacterium]|nr:NUDIX domain-containing protein [Bacilli bacterium]
MDKNRHFCASVYIINPRDKKILLVKHKKLKKWVQPGGHIEHNEIPEEAAVREAYEETGLKIKLLGDRFPREEDFIRPLGIQKNRNEANEMHIDITYPAIPLGEDIVLSDESTGIRWFSRDELDDLNVFEDIKINMDYILNNYINKMNA